MDPHSQPAQRVERRPGSRLFGAALVTLGVAVSAGALALQLTFDGTRTGARAVDAATTRLPQSTREVALTVELDGETPVLLVDGQVVATARYCSDLGRGRLLEREGGGYWLVSWDCQLALDARLRRADPLSLGQHLRRRGSYSLDLDEAQHVWLLRWAQLGLLACLLAGALIARVRRRSWLRGAVIGALVYAITGPLALVRVVILMG